MTTKVRAAGLGNATLSSELAVEGFEVRTLGTSGCLKSANLKSSRWTTNSHSLASLLGSVRASSCIARRSLDALPKLCNTYCISSPVELSLQHLTGSDLSSLHPLCTSTRQRSSFQLACYWRLLCSIFCIHS